jgi:ribosomal protein S26
LLALTTSSQLSVQQLQTRHVTPELKLQWCVFCVIHIIFYPVMWKRKRKRGSAEARKRGSGNIMVEAEAPRNMSLPLLLCFKDAVQILVDFF